MSVVKKCYRCGVLKFSSSFVIRSSSKDGLSSYCKICAAEYSAIYRAANQEKLRANKRNYYASNREAISSQRKIYRDNNRESIRAAKKQYYEANKDKILAYYSQWRESNPEKSRLGGRQYYARKLATYSDAYTVADLAELLMEFQGRCAYCFVSLIGLSKHLDHVHPLSKGGTDTIDNLVYTCPTCNISKGPKLLSEWLHE